MKISKKRYLQGFAFCVIILGIVRSIFPGVAGNIALTENSTSKDSADLIRQKYDVQELDTLQGFNNQPRGNTPNAKSKFFKTDGSLVKNRIYSVRSFEKAFPDQNDVQLIAAGHLGVKPVSNRTEAESRKSELVYVGSNPYFYIDRLNNSIPYLVPAASNLLQDIGVNFFDSLQMKGIPLHKIIITSVLRSQDDVKKLRGHNGNATENSCHLYGTTFDVSYNRYQTIADPAGPLRRKVRNDSLKWVLSEVLNDLRNQNRCYIKYEVKQGCFHITTR